MKVVLEEEGRIRFEVAGEGFEIDSDGVALSPYHLLAASLASCTALTVQSWAGTVGIATERLVITVTWELIAGHPKRVERMEQMLHWPELPVERLRTAERVAALCPIHATLNAGTVATSSIQRE